MEIKYSKKKQEIRKDPVLEALAHAKDFAVSNANALLVAAAALVLVAAGVLVYNTVKNAGIRKAQEAFGKAIVDYDEGTTNPAAGESLQRAVEEFKTVADNNKNSPQAIYSAYLLGGLFLRQEQYDQAIMWFNSAVSSNPHTGFVGAAAYEGLALCYEAKGNLPEALDHLKKALGDKRLEYRKAELEWRAALISRELKKFGDAKDACGKILSDTVSDAAAYKQKAENLLTEISIQEKQ